MNTSRSQWSAANRPKRFSTYFMSMMLSTKRNRTVSAGEIGNLPGHFLRRFGPKLHALCVQSTKCTVMFFPPPTAPRTFVEQDPIEPLRRLPQLRQEMVVIVIVGWTGFRKVREE